MEMIHEHGTSKVGMETIYEEDDKRFPAWRGSTTLHYTGPAYLIGKTQGPALRGARTCCMDLLGNYFLELLKIKGGRKE